MAYHMKDERIIATLLDFDLATFPDKMISNLEGAEHAGASESVTGSPSPSAVLNKPRISNAPSAPTSLYKAANVGKPRYKNIRRRSGTPPFMAIEALDFHLFPYVHNLWHDLESILYAFVWHGVGYRWKAVIIPWTIEDYRRIEVLQEWRVWSREDVANKKTVFLVSPVSILSHIAHSKSRKTCWFLSTLFARKMMVIRDRQLAREIGALSSRTSALEVIFLDYNPPLYPFFADILGFDRVECRQSCCVKQTLTNT